MRDPVTLLRRLDQHPAAFDFHGALRQLECAFPDSPRIGQAARPAQEALRFGQQPSLAFAASMLAEFTASDAGRPPRLLLDFFGLLGANGPMPLHLTEYIRDRQRHLNDPTLARFCDVFNHRMISLFYRAWASAQPAVSLDRPQDDHFFPVCLVSDRPGHAVLAAARCRTRYRQTTLRRTSGTAYAQCRWPCSGAQ